MIVDWILKIDYKKAKRKQKAIVMEENDAKYLPLTFRNC